MCSENWTSQEALASYDKAIALKPDFAAAHYNRGNALMILNSAEEALASYDKAVALVLIMPVLQ